MSTRITCAECGGVEVVEDGDNSFRVMSRHVCATWDDEPCRACATGVPHACVYGGAA